MKIRQIMSKFLKEETVTPELLLDIEGIRQRNQERIEAIKRDMGEKYILHPSHTKSRLDTPRPV